MTTLTGEMTAVAKKIRRAWNAGVSLLGVSTPDQRMLIDQCRPVFDAAPAVQWDCAAGLAALNPAGETWLKKVTAFKMPKPGQPPAPPFSIEATVDLVTTLTVLLNGANGESGLPNEGVAFLMNAHRFTDDRVVVQSLSNCRDPFKHTGRLLVMLAPHWQLPVELKDDVVTVDEPLPSADVIKTMLATQYANLRNSGYNVPDPDAQTVERAVDAVLGIPAFPAENGLALAMTPTGIDIEEAWHQKRATIAQTRGCSVYTGPETFDSIGGLDALKSDLMDLFNGPQRPRGIVWLDELEKLTAGSRGDLSGVAQDAEAVLLTAMQEQRAIGILIVGVPGGGKSEIAKACQSLGVVMRADTGAMTGSLVGESQNYIRSFVKMVAAVTQGRSLWIATCNDISGLKPEVIERFRFGTYYVGLPDNGKRSQPGDGSVKSAIWTIKMAQYGVDPNQPRPDDTGWVGRNIDAVCERAAMTNRSLVYAGSSIVGFGKANAHVVEALEQQADGKWLDANTRGTYSRPLPEAAASVAPATRQIRFTK
jgi:hypothetical protein